MSKNKKFRVKKNKFLNALVYLEQINKMPLEQLDLTEFFGDKDISKSVKEWSHIGLTNKDFITIQFDRFINGKDPDSLYD